MDKADERETAAEIEAAIPGAQVAVEDVTLPAGEPAQVAVIEGGEPERPHNEADMAYRLGRLETRLVRMEEAIIATEAKLSAFAEATVAAVEAEAAEIEAVGEVAAATADEVLPPDHEAATAVNPDHGKRNLKAWEHFLAGRGRPKS